MEMDACGSLEITLMNKSLSKWCETAARERKWQQGGEAKKKAVDEHFIRRERRKWTEMEDMQKKQVNGKQVEL